jgi:hypothetical protein
MPRVKNRVDPTELAATVEPQVESPIDAGPAVASATAAADLLDDLRAREQDSIQAFVGLAEQIARDECVASGEAAGILQACGRSVEVLQCRVQRLRQRAKLNAVIETERAVAITRVPLDMARKQQLDKELAEKLEMEARNKQHYAEYNSALSRINPAMARLTAAYAELTKVDELLTAEISGPAPSVAKADTFRQTFPGG